MQRAVFDRIKINLFFSKNVPILKKQKGCTGMYV